MRAGPALGWAQTGLLRPSLRAHTREGRRAEESPSSCSGCLGTVEMIFRTSCLHLVQWQDSLQSSAQGAGKNWSQDEGGPHGPRGVSQTQGLAPGLCNRPACCVTDEVDPNEPASGVQPSAAVPCGAGPVLSVPCLEAGVLQALDGRFPRPRQDSGPKGELGT